MPLQPGTTLGPYSVTAKIGEGGMGDTHRPRSTHTKSRAWIGLTSLIAAVLAQAATGAQFPNPHSHEPIGTVQQVYDATLLPDRRIRNCSKRAYLDTLGNHAFCIRRTAKALGMPYHTLRSRLDRLDLLDELQWRRAASQKNQTDIDSN